MSDEDFIINDFLNFKEDYDEDYPAKNNKAKDRVERDSDEDLFSGDGVINFREEENYDDYAHAKSQPEFEKQVLEEIPDALVDEVIIAANDEKNIDEISLVGIREKDLFNKSSASSDLLHNYLEEEVYDEDNAPFLGFDDEDLIVEKPVDIAVKDIREAHGESVVPRVVAPEVKESFVSQPVFEFVEKPEFGKEAIESYEKSKEISAEATADRLAAREVLTGGDKVDFSKKLSKKKSKHDNRNNFPAPVVSVRQVDGVGRQADLINNDGSSVDLKSGVYDQEDGLDFYDEEGVVIKDGFSSGGLDSFGEVSISTVSKPAVIKPAREVGNGRLNVKELEFFNNLALRKTKDSLSDGFASFVNPPVNIIESTRERKEREARINLALFGEKGVAKKGSTRFTDGDKMVLEFLALFKYSTNKHLAILFGVKLQAVDKRLRKLREIGLIKIKEVYGIGSLFYLTEAGMMLSGYDLPRVTDQSITYSMFSHQFAVNHVSANLWFGGLNVLNEREYPVKNRVDKYGRELYGDLLTSELEIQSSLGKMRNFDKASAYKPLILNTMREQFREWARAGRQGLSPEFSYGNEFMWALYPPTSANLVYHVPDLVVKRPRNADGSSNSIAVEIELLKKSPEAYERTLEAYRTDKVMYKKVIWVCKTVGPAKIIERLAKENGMWQEGRLRIVPILTHEGRFTGKNVWEL